MNNQYRSDVAIFVLGGNGTRAEAFVRYLTSHGCPAVAFADRLALVARMAGHTPGLVLVQTASASPDALIGILSEIRTHAPVPCIIHAQEPDHLAQRIHGLENGVDDWIPAATAPREVLARIRAVLRRSRSFALTSAVSPLGTRYNSEDPPRAREWHLSAERRELYTPNRTPCLLTSAEFDLLWALVQKPGVPVARVALSQAVFRRPWYPDDRGLDNLVARLRRKLAPFSENPGFIKPIRGAGYVFTRF